MEQDYNDLLATTKQLERAGMYRQAAENYRVCSGIKNSTETIIGINRCQKLSDKKFRPVSFDDVGCLTIVWENPNAFEYSWINFLLSDFEVKHVLLTKVDTLPPYSLIVAYDLTNINLRTLILNSYMDFRPVFLYQPSDECYVYGDYLIYKYCNWVFRNYYIADLMLNNVSFMPLGFGKGVLPVKDRSIEDKKYTWGFIGETKKSTRLLMVEALSCIQPNYIHSANGFNPSEALNAEQYSNLMSQFTFSPSPVGNFNVECFRVWESLELGSIPIVEVRRHCHTYRHLVCGDVPFFQITNWHEGANLISLLSKNEEFLRDHSYMLDKWWKRTKMELKRHMAIKIIQTPSI